MKEFIRLYLKAFKWFLIVALVASVGLLFIKNELPKKTVFAFGKKGKYIVAVRDKRSVELLSEWVGISDSMQKLPKTDHWRYFLADSLRIKHGDSLKIVTLMADSLMIKVKVYDTLIEKFSQTVYVHRNSVVSREELLRNQSIN